MIEVDPFYDDMACQVLSMVATFHQSQDDGDATTTGWGLALQVNRVPSVSDAVEAVVRHYTDPGNNPFIEPAHVIAGVRAIRARRLIEAKFDQITPAVDPDRPDFDAAYRKELAALRTAICNGVLDVDAYRAGRVCLTGPAPMRALEGPKGQHVELSRVFRRPERPTESDYGAEPVRSAARVVVPKTVSPAQAEAMEAERERGRRALELLMSTSTHQSAAEEVARGA